jgi:hypothetical protein
MSYIFIDADASRRCAALIGTHAAQLTELIGDSPDAFAQKLEAYCQKLSVLSADLLNVTEAYAETDDRMKALHFMINEGGRLQNGNQ